MKKLLFYFGFCLYVYVELYVLLVDPTSIYYDPVALYINAEDGKDYKAPVMESVYLFCHVEGQPSLLIFIEKNRRWAGYLFTPIDYPYVHLQKYFVLRDPHVICHEDGKDTVQYDVWKARSLRLWHIVRGIALFLPWLCLVILEWKDWRRLGISTLLYVSYLVLFVFLLVAWWWILVERLKSFGWVPTFVMALCFALLTTLAYKWYKRSSKGIFLIIPVVIACSMGLFHLIAFHLVNMVKNWL